LYRNLVVLDEFIEINPQEQLLQIFHERFEHDS